MGAIGHDGLAVPGRVVLAHEPPFALGALRIIPATRQVEAVGRSQTLEPRVMQVLVALARADGAIVTRDELIDRCWDGRIVTDDAINRVLSRLRHLAGEFGGAFQIETITKVGYRLKHSAQDDSAEPDGPNPLAPALDRRGMIIGAAAVTGVVAVGGILALTQGRRTQRIPAEARTLFARADTLAATGDPADDRQAIAYLREAVRIAPEYGEAWGALALAYRGALLSEAPNRTAGFEQLLAEAARNARRHDPGNGDAEVAVQVRKSYFGRWAEMERIYRSLGDRLPGHPTGPSLLGALLMDVGRWSDAVASLREVKRRYALSPITRYRLAVALWSAGRISEAEDEIDEAMRRWPQHSAIWQTRIKIMALTGRAGAALDFAQDTASRPLDDSDDAHRQRRIMLQALASGSETDVRSAVDMMESSGRAEPMSILSNAIMCARLGRTPLALDMLDGLFRGIGGWAFANASLSPAAAATHPLFQPHAESLWPERRFTALLDHIGLQAYWRRTGTLPDYRRA